MAVLPSIPRDRAKRRHGGGVVGLLLSAAGRASNPSAGVQVAGVGVERHDIAGQVGRALVAVQAQVRDVLAPVFLDQPSCRSVEPVLLLLGGRIGPPFGRSRQQDLDGDDAVRPAALLPASSTAYRAGMRAAASAAGSSEPMKTRFICARRGSALGVGTARVIWFADAANAPAVLIFS